MKANTRIFGEIEIAEDKIITFPNGMVGFPDMKHFTIIRDAEKVAGGIMWFQSMDEPSFAMPVLVPNEIVPDYNPTINDEYLIKLGELTDDNTYVLVTVRVPKDITQMSINLKGPIIINTDTLVAEQVVVEDEEYKLNYMIYDILKERKSKGGDGAC